MTTLQNYIPNNFLKLDDPSALGKQVTQELQKISNSIGVANQGITANTASITADEAAWTAYTPVITAGAGTITTASATGRWHQIGKTVFVYMAITVTTNGTGASFVNATLPVAAKSTWAVIPGRETAVTGKMLQGAASGINLIIINYDNSYPAANGYVLMLTGSYESA
jgi:hypothetical protein